MPSCSVFWCKKRSQTSNQQKDDITFHLFPKDIGIRSVWVKACGNHESWTPKRTSTICSAHFVTSCFIIQSNNKRRLKQGSIPTLKLLSESSSLLYYPTTSNLDVSPSKDDELNSDDDCDESEGILMCSKCRQSIKGCVVVCVQCADSKWCSACADLDLHPRHYLIRVPPYRPQNEINEVLQSLKLLLVADQSATSEDTSEDSDGPIADEPESETSCNLTEEQKEDVISLAELEQTNTEEMMVVVKSEVEEVDPLMPSVDFHAESLVVKIETDLDCTHLPDVHSPAEPDRSTKKQSDLETTHCDIETTHSDLSTYFKNFGNSEAAGTKKTVVSRNAGKRPPEDIGTCQVYTHSVKNKKSASKHPPS